MKITIYCASSDDIARNIKDATAELADALYAGGHTLLCGGGNGGLMKILADRARPDKDKIIGVMPAFMQANLWANPNIEHFITTETLAERKQFLIENAQAFIVLPGGFGTLEEFFDTLVLKKLGRINAPIIIYNLEGFYDSFLASFDDFKTQKVIKNADLELFTVVDTMEQVLAQLS